MALRGKRFCLTGMFQAESRVKDKDALSDSTGRLDIGKDEVSELIRAHGGAVTSAVSGKTSYLLAGERPGGAKLKKASMLGTKLIDAKGLKDLIAGEVPAAPSIGILSSGFEGNAIARPRIPGALDEDAGDPWNLLCWIDR